MFEVDSIYHEGWVCGRNFDRQVPVGTTFTAVRRYRLHRDTNGDWTELLGELEPVFLTLREVHWYSHRIDSIPSGHSAGLVFTGTGMAELSMWLAELPASSSLILLAFEIPVPNSD